MTSDRWKRIHKLFEAASAKPPEERSAFLAEACGEDSDLRAEVDSLLKHDQQAGSGFMRPPERGANLQPPDSPGDTDETREASLASGGPVTAIEGYEIIRKIHGGGQGVVYQAFQISTRRKVAIKVLHEGPFASPDSRERFKREIGLVAGLDHPHIVKVLDSGVAEGNYFYAMDYIRGGTLAEFAAEKQLSVEDILTVFAKICNAVHYAHRKGVIHRDLKPSNILIDRQGEPHLVDFGMAKVAGGSAVGKNRPMLISITGLVIGTLPYMSPEQAMGDTELVDARTD